MRPIFALVDREWSSSAQFVLAIVKLQKILEEVMRAMLWEALLEECCVRGPLKLVAAWARL